jgi:tight adherence protein C
MMSYIDLLFDQELMVTVLTAVATFATIVTLTYPLLAGDRLNARLKSVATRREELRRMQREALGKKGQLRSTPGGFMKETIEKLNLRNILESANSKEKLSRAGFRGQSAIYTFGCRSIICRRWERSVLRSVPDLSASICPTFMCRI